MAISEQDKRAIDEAVQRGYFVEKDKEGNQYIEMYADYNDTNEFLLQQAYDMAKAAFQAPTAEIPEPDKALRYALEEQISESYEICRFETEDTILRMAGFEPCDDMEEEQRQYLWETYPLVPPYDHFLDQSMKVNILLETPEEKNHDFALTHLQYIAMSDPDGLTDSSPEAIQELLAMPSSLKRLLEQQGHTMAELAATMKDYKQAFYGEDEEIKTYHISHKRNDVYQGILVEASSAMDAEIYFEACHPDSTICGIHEARAEDMKPGKPVLTVPEDYRTPLDASLKYFNRTHNPFLTSLCQELENQSYSMGCMTVLATMTMNDFINMMKPGKEVTMPKNSMVGIFNPWQGAGSVLEVELEKPLVFRSEEIYEVQIEGVKPEFGWTVDQTYGLVGSCWKTPVSISDADPERKPTLESMIQSAAQQSSAEHTEQGRGQEPHR